MPVMYLVYGAACALVELDALTQAFRVVSSDVVMDVGRPLEPALDIG